MLFIYVFFRSFHDCFYFGFFGFGWKFIYLHFFRRWRFFLFTFFSSVVVYFFTFSPALTFVFVSEKNRKISTFHKLCTIYIHQIAWTKQKIKSVFHFSLSLSLVPWIRICCPTWKVSDFLFINCALFPLFFVQNAEKKWAWVFDIWSKKKKKAYEILGEILFDLA